TLAVTTTVDQANGGFLIYTDTRGLPTIIEVPPNAVSETITLVYTPASSTTHPISPNLGFAGRFFALDVQRDGILQPHFPFSRPVTVTLHYTDTDVTGLDENSLTLDYWDEEQDQWVDAATTYTPPSTYDRHPDENWLAVPLCHLTDFALTGVRLHHIYLPLALKNYAP
ncbi:MAG: hypothetical protein ISS49_07990, partial [Anaerolineae bacterium]|nr:hypothetical protein [Anaerolineae bacterium]